MTILSLRHNRQFESTVRRKMELLPSKDGALKILIANAFFDIVFLAGFACTACFICTFVVIYVI